MKPVFERPVDTAEVCIEDVKYSMFNRQYSIKYAYSYIIIQDVYARNITVFMAPGTEILIQMMSDLSYPFPELVERTYITSSYDEYNTMTETNVLEKDSV